MADAPRALLAGAFAPYALRQHVPPEAALSDVRIALARREVQLAALLDIARTLEEELKQARVRASWKRVVGSARSACAAGGGAS